MNRYVTLVPVAVLILTGTGIVSQAYAAFTITMETDKDIYDHSSVITVTGQVDPIDPQSSDVSIQVFAPNGNLATVAQVTPSLDGNFSATINTASLKSDGTYMIKVQYVSVETTVSVELTNAIETPEVGEVAEAVTGTAGMTEPKDKQLYELSPGQIEYDITCNATPAFFANADDASVVIYLDATTDGIITVTLHEELIKPFEDGTFVIITDNQEMQDFTQVGNTLTVPCLAGTEKIEIHGSWAIPEFGVIAAMILAVAIVSIIVITAKTRLSLVPRY